MSQIILPGSHMPIVQIGAREGRKPVNLIIYKVLDPDDETQAWEIVPLKEVPGWLKEGRLIKAMVGGEMVQKEYLDKHWYRAEVQVAH